MAAATVDTGRNLYWASRDRENEAPLSTCEPTGGWLREPVIYVVAAEHPARALDHACYVHFAMPERQVPDKLTGLIGHSPDDLDANRTLGLRTFLVAIGSKRVGKARSAASEIVETGSR